MKIIKEQLTKAWESVRYTDKPKIKVEFNILQDVYNKDLVKIIMTTGDRGIEGYWNTKDNTNAGKGHTVSEALKDLEKNISTDDSVEYDITSVCDIEDSSCEEDYIPSGLAAKMIEAEYAYKRGETDKLPKLVVNPETNETEIVFYKPEGVSDAINN